MSDRAALPVVGHGPEGWSEPLHSRWSRRLRNLPVGETVDVLLDDGRIVRTTIRAMRLTARGAVYSMHVAGIVGAYSAHRIRPADGWWRVSGVSRV